MDDTSALLWPFVYVKVCSSNSKVFWLTPAPMPLIPVFKSDCDSARLDKEFNYIF